MKHLKPFDSISGNNSKLDNFLAILSKKKLGHATSLKNAKRIKAEGFNKKFNYFTDEDGWSDCDDPRLNCIVYVRGKDVYKNAYPDPEDFFDPKKFKIKWTSADGFISAQALIKKVGLDGFLDIIERSDTDEWGGNIVIIGNINKSSIISIDTSCVNDD